MSRTLLNVVRLTALSAGESMVKYRRPTEGISPGGGDTVWCHFSGAPMSSSATILYVSDKDSVRGRVVAKQSHIRIGHW